MLVLSSMEALKWEVGQAESKVKPFVQASPVWFQISSWTLLVPLSSWERKKTRAPGPAANLRE